MNATTSPPIRPEPFALADFDDWSVCRQPTCTRSVPTSAPHALALGASEYGAAYYLDGQTVYDGSRLAVRTLRGWLEGLFSWSGWIEDAPKLVFLGRIQPPLDVEPGSVMRWA